MTGSQDGGLRRGHPVTVEQKLDALIPIENRWHHVEPMTAGLLQGGTGLHSHHSRRPMQQHDCHRLTLTHAKLASRTNLRPPIARGEIDSTPWEAVVAARPFT